MVSTECKPIMGSGGFASSRVQGQSPGQESGVKLLKLKDFLAFT